MPVFFFALLLMLAPVAALAGPDLRIGNDRGGALEERVAIIEMLRAQGTRVEIRGEHCLSACTLYLGLPDVCISARTRFGFHGPGAGLYGVALPPSQFEYWSVRMASFYPDPLRDWFMSTGRYRLMGFYQFSGAELIGLGFTECT